MAGIPTRRRRTPTLRSEWQRFKRQARDANVARVASATNGEFTMDWNRVEGNWKQLKGKAKQQWGRLTEDDLTQAAGRREELAGKVQERYGLAKDAAQKQVDEWVNSADESWLKRQ